MVKRVGNVIWDILLWYGHDAASDVDDVRFHIYGTRDGMGQGRTSLNLNLLIRHTTMTTSLLYVNVDPGGRGRGGGGGRAMTAQRQRIAQQQLPSLD
jgi:hypothetical protein